MKMAIRINLSSKTLILVLGLVFLFLYEIEAHHKKQATKKETKSKWSKSSSVVEFDVTDFDAKGDGKAETTDEGENANSLAFIQAWQKACNSIGPSKLVIPEGTFVVAQVLFSGPCQSEVTVELKGNITADTDPSLFPNQELIVFQQVEGAKLTGEGTIDVNLPPQPCDPEKDFAFMEVMPSVKFSNATNCEVEGILSLNPAGFHILVQNSNNIIIRNTNFDTTLPTKPNTHTNAIYISESSLVEIKNSIIRTGDDCITVSGGSSDINITEITCIDGQGISVGAQLDGFHPSYDIKGVKVKNCTFKGTQFGVKVDPRPTDKVAEISNIIFEDLVMVNALNPISIKSDFPPLADKKQFTKILDVRFKDIRGTTSTNAALAFSCNKLAPCDSIEVADISLNLVGKGSILGKAVANLLSAVCVNIKVNFSGKNDGLTCP